MAITSRMGITRGMDLPGMFAVLGEGVQVGAWSLLELLAE